MKSIKKIIAIILGIALIAGAATGIVVASDKKLIKDYFPNYQYSSSNENYITLDGITIDASKDDDAWKNINPYHQVSIAENRDTLKYSSYDNILEDCDVDVYTYLGEDGLFIYAETNDQIVNTYNTTVFGKSGLEFYICDATALTKLDHLYEYTIGADGFIKLRIRNKEITGTETYITKPCIGIERSAKLLPSGGYAIETFIPYETIGIASKPKEIHIGTAIIRNIDAVDTTNYIWELLGMNTNGVAPNNNTTFPIFDENGYRPFAVGENFGVVNSNIVDLTDDRGFHPVTKTYNRGTVAAFLDMDPVKNVYLETTVKIDDFNYTDDPRVGLILRGEKKSDGSFDQVYFMFELDKDAKTKYTIKDILMLPSNTKAGNDWTKSQKYLVDSKLNDSSFKLSVLKDDDAFYFYIDDVLLCKRSGIKQLLNSKVTPGIASWFTGATFSNYYVRTNNVTSYRNNKTELFIGDSNKVNINIDLTSENDGYITTNTTANNQAIVNYMNPADSQFYTTLTIEDFEAYNDCKDGRVGYSFTTYYDGGYKRFFVLLRGNNDTGYTNLDTYVVDKDDFGGTNWAGVKNIYSAKLKLDGKTNLDVYRNKNLLYLVINNNVIKCLDLKDTDVNKNMTVGLTAWKVKSKLSNYALYEGDDFPSINSGLALNTNLFDNFKSVEKFELKDGKINIYQHVQAIAEKAATAKISDNASATAYVSSNIKKPSNTSATIDPRVGVMLESNPDKDGNKGRIQLLLEYDKGGTTPKSFVILPATYDGKTEKWTSDWTNSKRISDLTNYLIKDTNKLSITKEGKEFKYYINDIEVKGLTGNIVNNLKYFGDTSKVSGLITSQYTDAVFSEMSFTDKLPVFVNTITVTPSNRVASENIYFELSSKLANCSGNLENMQGVALLSEDNLTSQNLLVKYNNLGNPTELLLVKATREALDKEWTYDFDNKITYSITSILDSDEFKLAMSKDGANVNLYIKDNLIASRSDLFESSDKVVDATVEYNTTGEFDDQAYEKPVTVVEKYVANNNNKIVNIDFLQDDKIVADTASNNQSSIYFYEDATDKLMAKAHVKFNSVQSSATDGRVGIILTDGNGTTLFVALKGLTDGKITNIDSLEYKNDVIAPWADAIKSLGSVNFAPNTNEADLAVLRNGNKLFVLANNSIVKTIDLSTAGWTMSGDTKVGFTSWKSNAEITDVELITDEDVKTTASITYVLNEGTNHEDNPSTFNIGDTITLKNPTRAGYGFCGWYTTSTFDEGTEITTVSGINDVTVYAKWEFGKYTVTFNADGGTVDPTSKQVTYLGTYGELPTPTKTNCIFDGWYIGTTKIESTSTVEILDSCEAKAKWNLETSVVTSKTNSKETYKVNSEESADLYIEELVKVNEIDNTKWARSGIRIGTDANNGLDLVIQYSNTGVLQNKLMINNYSSGTESNSNYYEISSNIGKISDEGIKLAIAKKGNVFYFYANDALLTTKTDSSYAADTKVNGYIYNKYTKSTFTSHASGNGVDAFMSSKNDMYIPYRNSSNTTSMSFDYTSQASNVVYSKETVYKGSIIHFNEEPDTKQFIEATIDMDTLVDKSRYQGIVLTDSSDHTLAISLRNETSGNKKLVFSSIASKASDISNITTTFADGTTANNLYLAGTSTTKFKLGVYRNGDTLVVYVNDAIKFSGKLSNLYSSLSTEKLDAGLIAIYANAKFSGITYNTGNDVSPMITFDCNGIGSANSIIATAGSSISLPTLVSSGLSFKGWYTDEALMSKFEESTMPSSDTKLYAKWSASMTNTSGSVNSLMIGSSSYSKFSIECDITPKAVANVWAQVGLTLQNSSGTKAYFYFGNGNSTGTINFNGVYINKDTEKSGSQSGNLKGSSSLNATGTNKFKLSVNNNQITMYVNGVEASSFAVTRHTDLSNDDTYKLGLMSKGTTVDFNNIKITSN